MEIPLPGIIQDLRDVATAVEAGAAKINDVANIVESGAPKVRDILLNYQKNLMKICDYCKSKESVASKDIILLINISLLECDVLLKKTEVEVNKLVQDTQMSKTDSGIIKKY